jgi:hypothetical protein
MQRDRGAAGWLRHVGAWVGMRREMLQINDVKSAHPAAVSAVTRSEWTVTLGSSFSAVT